jgi:hypothetical protein
VLKVIGRLRFYLITLVLLFALTTPALAAQVMINGNQYNFETINYNGTTLVPLRGIFEALGASVNWESDKQIVAANKGQSNIQLTIGSKTAYRNGEPVNLQYPGALVNGITMVPLRFVSESLGANVNWDSSTQKISISYSEPVITNNYVAPAADVVKSNDVLTWSDGTKYEGRTINGEANGMGKITLPNGTIYSGNFINGKLNGEGSVVFSNGAKYTGELVDGKLNGEGTFIYPDGTKYIGEFKDNNINGKGTIYDKNNFIIIGQFKNGKPDGKCTLINSTGQTFTCIFSDGKITKVDSQQSTPNLHQPPLQQLPIFDIYEQPTQQPNVTKPAQSNQNYLESQKENIKKMARDKREKVLSTYNKQKESYDRLKQNDYDRRIESAINRGVGSSGLLDYIKQSVDELFAPLYERLEIERDRSLSEIDNWENLTIQQLY